MDKNELFYRLYRLSVLTCRSQSKDAILRACKIAKRDQAILESMPNLNALERWQVTQTVQRIIDNWAMLSYHTGKRYRGVKADQNG